MTLKTDYLVLGSGIAGLSFAIKIAEHYKLVGREVRVDVFSKAELEESNTKYAQGGIAAVQNNLQDSFEKHIIDTLNCGGGLPDRRIVERVVKAAPKQINTLIDWGTNFDRNDTGEYHLAKEGGHSESRILHSKDSTGLEIEKSLLEKAKSLPSIHMHYNHFAVDLLVEDNECFGAIIVDQSTQTLKKVFSAYTLLATGGIGQVYKRTTNPIIATGDGIAMAQRVGASVNGMEFVQFHPTALWSNESPSFLISEAVRGFGGVLTNAEGKDFCSKYDARASLAPRDVVARAIAFEVQSTNIPFVNLKVSHLDLDAFKKHFPNIYEKCESERIDLSKDSIPVVPAAHYLCGGVRVDENGESSVKGLLACGECANTGLHGSNRLASNSLLEGVAYAEFCFQHAICNQRVCRSKVFDEMLYPFIPEHSLKVLKGNLQQLMTKYSNIVKSVKGLQIALSEIDALEQEFTSFETRISVDVVTMEYGNMLAVAKLIVQQALDRKENIGLHYVETYT
jgi:L-aspartate oxidase